MARIKNQDIRDMSLEDLNDRISDESLQFKKKKFAHAVSPLDNPLELKWRRRDIARLKTELTRRIKEENKA